MRDFDTINRQFQRTEKVFSVVFACMVLAFVLVFAGTVYQAFRYGSMQDPQTIEQWCNSGAGYRDVRCVGWYTNQRHAPATLNP